MKRTVVYARVSTDEQGKGYSLPTQLAACRQYSMDRGYQIVAEFSDEHTGTELDRPGLNELRKVVGEHGVDCVVVYDIDRLARNVYFQLHLEREFSAAGVNLEYALGQYQETPEGNLLKRIKADIAEYENAQRVERSRRGKAGRVHAGYVIVPAGRAPFGYDYFSEPHRGFLRINEQQASIVRMMYEWLVEEGLSSYEIAKRLWKHGILSKGDVSEVVAKKAGRGEWSPATVRRIISNPVYKGTWHWGKTRRREVAGKKKQVPVPESDWIAVSVPSIVDPALWQQAQECLTHNKQAAKRNSRRDYLLRGMIFCACGRRWTGRYKNHLNRAYYRCPTSEAEHWRSRCTMPGGIRQDVIEHAVWDSVENVFLDPTNLQAELARRRLEAEAEHEAIEQRQGEIEAALNEIDRKIGILLDQVLSDSFPKQVIEERKKSLLAERQQLKAEAERLVRTSRTVEVTAEQEVMVVDFAEKVRVGFRHANLTEKRRILEIVGLRVDVITPKQIRVTALISDGSFVATLSA